MIVETSRETFEAEVLQSELPVMVDFWGPRCGPCLALKPAVETLEQRYRGRLKVAELNAAENRMLCARLQVLGLPAFVFYRAGAEVKRVVGESTTPADLVAAIEEVLAGS